MSWTKEDRATWQENENRLVAKMRADLAAAHGISGHPKEPKVWALAWEYGHAYGANEIRSYYDDIAEVIK